MQKQSDDLMMGNSQATMIISDCDIYDDNDFVTAKATRMISKSKSCKKDDHDMIMVMVIKMMIMTVTIWSALRGNTNNQENIGDT